MIVYAVFSPAFAAGAAAVAVGVPLLIHLLFRRRYQIVPWAATRFLLIAERRHRRRIDQWPLLVLRTLALLLPLFAMAATTNWAEPLWQAIRPGATEIIANVPRTHHILVLDASFSMAARLDDGRTRFDKALVQAENLIRSSEPGDGYTLIVLGMGVDTIVKGPSNDPERVIAELHKVKLTHAAAEIAATLPIVADIIAQSPRAYPRRQLTFLTDLQRSAWINAIPKTDSTQTPEVWQRIFGRSDVVAVDVARSDVDNLAVSDVELVDPLPMVDSPAVLKATVVNFGPSEKRNVRVQVLVGRPLRGTELLASVCQTVIDTIPGQGGRSSVVLGREGQICFREKGVHILQVKLLEADDLSVDDSRFLAVQVREGLETILVDGSNDLDPWRRAAGYLSRALFPPNASPADTPARPRTMTPNEFLDPAVGDLSRVDCVYLCDLPTPNRELAAKLEAHLKRGGGIVIGLGPQSAANISDYNRVLFNEGSGILPGPLGEVVNIAKAEDGGFKLAADEEAYLRSPLQFFQDEKARGGLFLPTFRSFVRLSLPPGDRTRRILSFVVAKAPQLNEVVKPDAALVEWSKHRGRVVVFTSSFNENWNDWPPLPSYLMFHQELLRFAATSPDRHTLRIGEALEDYFPPETAGLSARLKGPGDISATLPIVLQDESGFVRFTDTRLSGLYRLEVEGHSERVFAFNVPEVVPGLGAESDLKRIDQADLRTLGPIQVVADTTDVKPTTESGATLTSMPKPHGPMIARIAILIAIAVLVLESLVAWRSGPARAASVAGNADRTVRPVERKRYLRILSTALALLPLAAALALLGVVVHYERTGDLLGFLPEPLRQTIERAASVPTAQPGEGTRWRLEGFTTFVRNAIIDRRLVLMMAAACMLLAVVFYRMERRAISRTSRLVVPFLLRISVFLLAIFALLPQLRLAFDREGWPEVVILIDTSASMAHVDDLKDPAVRAKAEELAGTTGLPNAQRLKLAQLLLTRKDSDWLDRLLKEKEVKVHIYSVSSETRPVAVLEQPSESVVGRDALERLQADGDSSRLGEGVEAILKTFRGGSLAAIVMLTDGVTTVGDSLPIAAREAARAGVPLFLVGVGDTWDIPDLALTDLQAEDTVTVGDRLVFDARLVAHGQVPANPLPVVLYEKVSGQLVERSRVVVTPDSRGNRVPVTVSHTPMEPGEKTYVLVAPTVPGETNTTNNRLERTIQVTESKRVRILYVEGYPRYDFRFVKVLLERESERSAGGKGIEVKVVLLNAAKGWEGTDRTALALESFPTREELFAYDVIVLGDVDPKLFPRSNRALQDIADFVKVKGGGLLFLSGEHGTPFAYLDTALAEILPVVPGKATPGNALDNPLVEEYQPRLTPIGRQHPLFRFLPDPDEAMIVWNRLRPLYWYAKNYVRKPNSIVLAVHPNRTVVGGPIGENHPLVLQAYVGSGPVMFFGFDDTWRWRFRNDEEHFDRFWIQTMRVLSRSRIRKAELLVKPKTDFRRDEKITVVARFPVESPAPPAGQPVRVSLLRSPLVNAEGASEVGSTETTILTLARVPGAGVEYQTTLTRTPEGEYRFTLVDPESPAGITPPSAVARVYPPIKETDRFELNKPDLATAAALSNGAFYSLATANNLFDDLKNLQRVPLNQPCPPIELWNHPAIYMLIVLLLGAEWLLRKRERLL